VVFLIVNWPWVIFFSDYFISICQNHFINASYYFTQLFLTPSNLNCTAQIGQALYRYLNERFLDILMCYERAGCNERCETENMFGQIGNSNLVEYEERISLITELELIALKCPYTKLAKFYEFSGNSSEFVLHSDKIKLNTQNKES